MTVPVMLMRMLAAAKSRAMKQGRELAEESMTAVTRKRLEAKQRKTIDEIKDLRRQIKEQTPADEFPPEGFSRGGRVIGPGLSGLLRGYTQGPLARVSRETQEPVGMFRGGIMGGFEPEIDFSNLKIDPSVLPAYAIPAQAAEALAAQTVAQAAPAQVQPSSTVQADIAAQRALEQAALKQPRPTDFGAFQNPEGMPEQTIYGSAPNQTPFEPGMLLYEGNDVLLSPTAPVTTPVATTPVETTPVETTPVETTPVDTAPVTTTPVETTPVETAPVATTPVETTPVETTPVETAPVATAPVTTTPTEPVYLPPVVAEPVETGPTAAEILAAEQAARDLAEAEEAERIRIAQEEADRIAAEQEAARIAQEEAAAELLAQQEAERIAAEQAAAQEAERLAAEQLAAQEAAAQAEAARLAEEEAQRIAAEQAAADAAAAQALADEQAALEALAQRQAAEEAAALAAEQEALAAAEAERVAAAQLAAEQLAAQQAAQLAAEQAAAAQLQAAEQLAAQQEAERIAMEAELAATPDPDPIYEAPTQGELLQAAETAQAAEQDLFTTPTETNTAIDRGAYGQVADPVTTTTTTAEPAQQNTSAVITEASDGTFHPTPAAAAAYEAELASQRQSSGLGLAGIQSLLNRVNLNVADQISDYTTGYPSSQGMEIQRTYMPFEGTEEERATGYVMPIYKPVANQRQMPALFRPRSAIPQNQDAFTQGSAAPGADSGVVNTGVQGTAPGAFGLPPTQSYQCGAGYQLQFVNGQPTCVRVGGGGPGKPPTKPPEIIDVANPGGMRYGGGVGLNTGIGSLGA